MYGSFFALDFDFVLDFDFDFVWDFFPRSGFEAAAAAVLFRAMALDVLRFINRAFGALCCVQFCCIEYCCGDL